MPPDLRDEDDVESIAGDQGRVCGINGEIERGRFTNCRVICIFSDSTVERRKISICDTDKVTLQNRHQHFRSEVNRLSSV